MSSKHEGNDRVITPRQKEMNFAIAEFMAYTSNENVDAEKSFVNTETGCYTIVFKNHNPHPEEIEAAHILNENGYDVQLRPEGEYPFAVSKRIKKGNKNYVDGIVQGEYDYEQHTPESEKNAVYKGLRHARDKGAKLPVIYDKKINIHKADVESGLVMFHSAYGNRAKEYFDTFLVIDHKRRKVYEWGI